MELLSPLPAAGPPHSPSPSLCAMPAAPAPKNTRRLMLAPCPVPRPAGWRGKGLGWWQSRLPPLSHQHLQRGLPGGLPPAAFMVPG